MKKKSTREGGEDGEDGEEAEEAIEMIHWFSDPWLTEKQTRSLDSIKKRLKSAFLKALKKGKTSREEV